MTLLVARLHVSWLWSVPYQTGLTKTLARDHFPFFPIQWWYYGRSSNTVPIRRWCCLALRFDSLSVAVAQEYSYSSRFRLCSGHRHQAWYREKTRNSRAVELLLHACKKSITRESSRIRFLASPLFTRVRFASIALILLSYETILWNWEAKLNYFIWILWEIK